MDDRICQSCGMPMVASEHFGTNTDHSVSDDYCCFCFQEGKFTDNFTLDEFMDDALKNEFAADDNYKPTVTVDERIVKEKIKLLELKRWKSAHHITHQQYYKSVNKALTYINQHLSSDLNLKDLAQEANISEYHFHRIFRSVMSESPGNYIQRLRLEKAAFLLQTTQLPIAEIAEQTGYTSTQSLSKAFKKKYGLSPIAHRTKPSDLTVPMRRPITRLDISPEIKEIGPKTVLTLQVPDPFNDENSFVNTWQKLLKFAGLDGIPGKETQYFSLSYDLSPITHPDYCRVYVCVNNENLPKAKGKYGIQTIPGGRYAVFTHKGPHSELELLYCNIYRFWIPNSEYCLRDSLHFERYLNNPDVTDETEWMTEVYIPVNYQ